MFDHAWLCECPSNIIIVEERSQNYIMKKNAVTMLNMQYVNEVTRTAAVESAGWAVSRLLQLFVVWSGTETGGLSFPAD